MQTVILPFRRGVLPESEMIYHRFLIYTDFSCWGIIDDIPPGRDLTEWLNTEFFECENLHARNSWVIYVSTSRIILAEMDTNGVFLDRIAVSQNYEELVWYTHYDCCYNIDTTPYEQKPTPTLSNYYQSVLLGKNGVPVLDTYIHPWGVPVGWPVIYLSLSDHNPEKDTTVENLCATLGNVKI